MYKQNLNKMKNLELLQEELSQFEMVFNEDDKIRFSEFIGEEMESKSFEKQLIKAFGFKIPIIEINAIGILPMKRKKQMKKCFDDGWLHLEFPKSLFSKSFLNEMEERFDN